MEKVVHYYTITIFKPTLSQKIKRQEKEYHYPLKLIGEGSYAQIFKFKDEYYQKIFALKVYPQSSPSGQLYYNFLV